MYRIAHIDTNVTLHKQHLDPAYGNHYNNLFTVNLESFTRRKPWACRTWNTHCLMLCKSFRLVNEFLENFFHSQHRLSCSIISEVWILNECISGLQISLVDFIMSSYHICKILMIVQIVNQHLWSDSVLRNDHYHYRQHLPEEAWPSVTPPTCVTAVMLFWIKFIDVKN